MDATRVIASALFVAGSLATPAAGQTSASPSDDFCTRLARDSGIDKPSSPYGRTQWTVSAANLGHHLFGGSTAIGLGVMPVEPATVADYKRLEDMCLPEGKGAICKLVGPVNFKFIWKGRRIITPLAQGEQATVTARGTKTTCQSEAQPQSPNP